MRILSLFFTICFSALLMAQEVSNEAPKRFRPIEITKPEVLVDADGIKCDAEIWKAAKKGPFTKHQLKMMVWYGRKDLRPKHLQDHFLDAERPYFKHMRALELIRIGESALIMIAGPENEHLPKEIRPQADLYMVVPTNSYVDAQPWDRLPVAADLMNGPSVKGLSKFKLHKPENIFGTADVRTNDAMQAALKAVINYRDVKHVNYRSNESGWPTGMNSLIERQALYEAFKKYKAYALTEVDGKILLIIPATKNKKITRRARPLADIYLVVNVK